MFTNLAILWGSHPCTNDSTGPTGSSAGFDSANTRFDDPLKNRWSIVAVSSHGWWLTSPYQFWCHLSIMSYYPLMIGLFWFYTPFLVFQSIIFEPLHTCQGLTVVLLVEERIWNLHPARWGPRLRPLSWRTSLGSLWFVWDIPSGKLT